MKESENVGLFDMDGSLANYNKALHFYLSLMRGPNENPADDYNDKLSHIRARQNVIKSLPGFWLNLERIEAGFKVYKMAVEIGFQPHILTKAPRKHTNACTEKMDWCRLHVPGTPVTITEDKGLTYGKFLFDDWPDYMLRWLEWRPRGLGIMLSQPWNVGFKHPNVFIVNQNDLEKSLSELYPLLLKTYNRK